MGFERPITIKKALDRIATHEYVLPAIQREFVWRPTQICRLFDSLMRGYPIGSFLFWKVEAQNTRQFRFYDFMRDYHQRERPHCPRLDLLGDRGVTAVLDGQQRLTALNIGLRGSHAEKEPRKWWSNPGAFPVKQLYLNLLADAGDNEEGALFDFRFLKEDRAKQRDDAQFWFPVRTIFDYTDATQIFTFLQKNELLQTQSQQSPFEVLEKLRKMVFDEDIINFYLEEEQDLDKVLNIFIRINSGGTVLSYSDLLLSIATAQWEERDARKAIHDLVDDLNSTGIGFAISKDFVLKAGLMLTDIASVGFKVTNFNADNMKRLEDNWPRISKALKLSVRLASDFGFSARTLKATSALLPIAYYFYQREAGESYLRAKKYHGDREAIRHWLLRSLLKSGVWGSGLDTMLTMIRTELKRSGQERFPVEEIEAVMARRGRSLRFSEDEIRDLLEVSYNDRRSFALLTLLYPFVDLRNKFHIDHIFPKSRFTENRLRRENLDPETVGRFREYFNRLPNLQLLDGTENREKSAVLPAKWLELHFKEEAQRQAFRDRHDLGEVPDALADFEAFYLARRDAIAEKLRALIGEQSNVSSAPTPSTPSAEAPAAAPDVAEAPTWSSSVLDLLSEVWHPLARALMDLSVPEPEEIESELQKGGLNVEHRCVLKWSRGEQKLALVSVDCPAKDVDEKLIRVAPDADAEPVAKEIEVWLGGVGADAAQGSK